MLSELYKGFPKDKVARFFPKIVCIQYHFFSVLACSNIWCQTWIYTNSLRGYFAFTAPVKWDFQCSSLGSSIIKTSKDSKDHVWYLSTFSKIDRKLYGYRVLYFFFFIFIYNLARVQFLKGKKKRKLHLKVLPLKPLNGPLLLDASSDWLPGLPTFLHIFICFSLFVIAGYPLLSLIWVMLPVLLLCDCTQNGEKSYHRKWLGWFCCWMYSRTGNSRNGKKVFMMIPRSSRQKKRNLI